MPKVMFKVLRYVEIGQRKYDAGQDITDDDVETWCLPADEVQRRLTTAVAKGQVEPITERGPEPVAAIAAQVEHDADEVSHA